MRDISLSYEDGSTLYGADAILQQYEITLFTVPPEFSPVPEFGIGVQRWVSEPNNKATAKSIEQQIRAYTQQYFPELTISGMLITQSSDSAINVQITVDVIPYKQRRRLNKDISL